jgi:pyruvate dehydrogenase E2 component (dihydrolipoamide acetyltransferase)
MGRVIPLSNNRKNVYQFITRAKNYHASISATYDIDVTYLSRAIEDARGRGERASFTSCMVRATALVLERFPRFNRHFFHGIFGRFEYEFDGIHCGLFVSRKSDEGEDIIVPATVRDANKLSLAEIDAVIHDFKTRPLLELPAFQATHKLRGAPGFVRSLIAFGARTSPRVQEKLFAGTYALSAIAGLSHARMVSNSALSPTACAFMPGSVADRAWVVDGQIAIRKILPLTLIVDHYVLDGSDAMPAADYLAGILSEPAKLGLRPQNANPASASTTASA